VWCVDDHFLLFECRIKVRYHAHLPVAFGRQPQRFGWRSVLAADAERALLELVRSGRGLEAREGTRPSCSARRDDDEPAGERVAAQLGRRLTQLFSLAASMSARSRNGRMRSIGAGKTIVELLLEPISSSVWR
jgi:hypothetical protein